MSRRPAHRVRGRWLAACWMAPAIVGCVDAAEIAAQVPDSRADLEALLSRVDEMFTEFTDQTPGCAVSVDHRGQLLHAAGYGLADLAHGIPIRPTTVFDLASVSKQFTAAAVLLLAREGRISLDDEVREHLPWLPRYERPITVRQLIHQTSGLRDVLSLWSLSGRDPEDHLQPRAVEAAIRRQAGLNHLPGARHSYSNTNYYLLARLVEAVDGRSFRDFLADELFGPLGMESTGVLADHGRIVPAMAESYAEGDDGELRRRLLKTDLVGASEAYSTVLDMARWNAFLAGASDPGVGGPAFVDSLFATSRLYGSGEENVYAFGVQNVSRRGVREISHGGTWGGFRTYFRHYPDSGLGVAVLCNQLEISPFQLSARVADVYLGDLVTGPEPEYRPPGAGRNTAPGAQVSREAFAPLLGRYYSPELDAVHTFSHEDGALWVQAGWQEPVRLSLRGELEFEHEGRTWSFAVEDGRVMGLRLDSGRVRGIDFERVSGPAIPEARSGPQTRKPIPWKPR